MYRLMIVGMILKHITCMAVPMTAPFSHVPVERIFLLVFLPVLEMFRGVSGTLSNI